MWIRSLMLFFLLAMGSPLAGEDPAWVTMDGSGRAQVHLWFFWSRNCPHCIDARVAVTRIAAENTWLRLHTHEVSGDRANAQLYMDMARRLDRQARSVPAFIMCGEMVTGFGSGSNTADSLTSWARACLGQTGGQGNATLVPAETAVPHVAGFDLAQLSLPAVTLLLAAMDAFNPCAFFVLLSLLSLLTHEHSRSRMLVIGGVFVLFSGLVYFSLMAAWLNVFLISGELRLITLAAGVVAITMATLSLKDYVWFGRSISLSIPDSAKPRLFERMRGLLRARSLSAMLVGTVTLALAANSYELLCTAGFPVIYTRLLTLQDLSIPAYYAYLALYNAVYVLPLLFIVLLYVRTLGSRKLSLAEGRILKLVSGLMMLGLGTALLLTPDYLSRPEFAGGLVLIALLVGVVAWRHEHGGK